MLLASEFRGPQAAFFVPMVLPVLWIISEAAFCENALPVGTFSPRTWGGDAGSRAGTVQGAPKQGLKAGEAWMRVFLEEEVCLFVLSGATLLSTVPQWGLEMKQFYLESVRLLLAMPFVSLKTLWSIFSCRICATSVFKQVSNHGVLSCSYNVIYEYSSQQAAATQLWTRLEMCGFPAVLFILS